MLNRSKKEKLQLQNNQNQHGPRLTRKPLPGNAFPSKLRWFGLGFILASVIFVLFRNCSQNTQSDKNIRRSSTSSPRAHIAAGEESDLCDEMKDIGSYCPDYDQLPTSWDPKSKKFTCDFRLSKDNIYTPSKEILECFKTHRNKPWEQAAAAFEERIKRLQFPKDCNKPLGNNMDPSWVYGEDEFGFKTRARGKIKLGNPKWNMVRFLRHGYAYNLYVMALNNLFHWSAGAPVLVSNSRYRFSDLECGRGWSCNLSPLSGCSLESVDPSLVMVYGQGDKDSTAMSMDQLCKPYGTYSVKYGRCKCDPGFMPSGAWNYFYCQPYEAFNFKKKPRYAFYKSLYESEDPQKQYSVFEGNDVHFANIAPGNANPLAHNAWVRFESVWDGIRKYGLLWQHSQVLWYMHKNSPKLKQLNGFVERIGIRNGGCVGVHVRHGDACTDKYQNHRKCLPLDNYMRQVETFVETYNLPKRVYLATDDPKVIQDTKNWSGFEFVVQDIDREMYSDEEFVSSGVDGREEFDSPERVNEIVLDIWGLSHCDAIVGAFTSSVVWVAQGLHIGRNGYYPPFASVDLPWGDENNIGRFYGRGNNRF